MIRIDVVLRVTLKRAIYPSPYYNYRRDFDCFTVLDCSSLRGSKYNSKPLRTATITSILLLAPILELATNQVLLKFMLLSSIFLPIGLLIRKEILLNLLLVLLMIRWRESIKLTNRKAQSKVCWALTSTEN